MVHAMLNEASGDDWWPEDTGRSSGKSAEDPELAGFRRSEYSQDEIEQFINGHTGDGNPASGRPKWVEVHEALAKAEPRELPGQNVEEFIWKNVRVIVNYGNEPRSTVFYLKGAK